MDIGLFEGFELIFNVLAKLLVLFFTLVEVLGGELFFHIIVLVDDIIKLVVE